MPKVWAFSYAVSSFKTKAIYLPTAKHLTRNSHPSIYE